MAIQYARLQYVQRSKGQSSCQKAAYNGRTNIYDQRQELNYDYSERCDGVYHIVMRPEGVSERYNDIADLWNTIESIEVRCNSQVAKEMILALPNDEIITMRDKIAMTQSFLQEHFVKHGIICQVDIHAPHSKENGSRWQKDRENLTQNDNDCHNWHAHVLMPTRTCQDELFGMKATHLDVDVRKGRVVGTDKQWGALWRDHQNKYFKENGIDLEVDPIGVWPEIHIRHRFKSKDLDDLKQKSRFENTWKSQDERFVVQHLLAEDSVFDKKDVDRFVSKHVRPLDREDFLGRFWSSKELVLVGEDIYTSKTVLREEQKMIRMADRLTGKTNAMAQPHYEIDLDYPQAQAVKYACLGPNLICLEGKIGSEKNRTLYAIKETYEAENKRVRVLTTTCRAADQMKQNDGFTDATQIDKFLFDHHNGKTEIQKGQEVWLVDDATTVSNPIIGELLDKAWRTNTKVILMGDQDRCVQNGRGGAFKAFTERFDSRVIESIIPQKDNAYTAILEKISEGKTTEALFDMCDQDAWHHHKTEQEAVRDLVDTWRDHYNQNPTDSFMIIEYRDQYTKTLNKSIHDVLKKRGEIGDEDVLVKTNSYGFCNFGSGDKIIFRFDDEQLGVHDGQRGLLVSAQKDEFVVRINDDHDIVFDPQQYSDFQHGYAGRVDPTDDLKFDHVFSLHGKHIDRHLFEVATSKHRLSCHYFSHGDRKQVFQDIEQRAPQELCPTALNAEPQNWLCQLVMSVVDYFSKNHEFYRNPHSRYYEKGIVITNQKEDARLQGYRTLYTEAKENWPSLTGQDICMTTQHRDLEPFLRKEGVGQCVLLDADRKTSQLIGPYDRFHHFYQDHSQQMRDHAITENQLRARLFALEQQFHERPSSAADMGHSAAYTRLIDHETNIRPELMKTHDHHTSTQILYHLEHTGHMPTSTEITKIQQRVDTALEKFHDHKTDQIFVAALEKDLQRQMQFQKDHQREMER